MVMVVVDPKGVSPNINAVAAICHRQARGGIYSAAVITRVVGVRVIAINEQVAD